MTRDAMVRSPPVQYNNTCSTRACDQSAVSLSLKTIAASSLMKIATYFALPRDDAPVRLDASASSGPSPQQKFLHALQHQLAALVENRAAQGYHAGGAPWRKFDDLKCGIERIF